MNPQPEAGLPASERDRVRAVLSERARALARPVAPPRAADQLELLAFGLGKESCAVEARFVHAVFRLGELTPLPGAVAPVAGVTGWRGQVLTLFDVRGLLGGAAGGVSILERVMVLGGPRPAIGILVGELREVLALERSELLPAAVTQERASEIVRGVTAAGLVVLDAERLLALTAEWQPT